MRCPTPDKQRYITHAGAAADLRWIQAHSNASVWPCRVYKCACGYWHLTSMTAFQAATRRHHA